MHDDDPQWIKMVAQAPLWKKVVDHYMSTGGYLFADGLARRCVSTNRMPDPDSPCWAVYAEAYP